MEKISSTIWKSAAGLKDVFKSSDDSYKVDEPENANRLSPEEYRQRRQTVESITNELVHVCESMEDKHESEKDSQEHLWQYFSSFIDRLCLILHVIISILLFAYYFNDIC